MGTYIYIILLLFPQLIFGEASINLNKTVIINCRINNLGEGNKIAIRIEGKVFDSDNVSILNKDDLVWNDRPQSNQFFSQGKNGYFHFKWDSINGPHYAVLYSVDRSTMAKKMIDVSFTIFPGDSITIYESNDSLKFTGTNAGRYLCEYEIYKLEHNPIIWTTSEDPAKLLLWYKRLDSLATESMYVLISNRGKLTKEWYDLLYMNIILYFQELKISYLRYNGVLANLKNNVYLSYLQDYKSPLWHEKALEYCKKNKTISKSYEYYHFLVQQYKYDSCIAMGKQFRNIECYTYLTKLYNGKIRENLIYSMFEDNISIYKEGLDLCIKNALDSKFIVSSDLKLFFTDFVKRNSENSPAFNFSLKDAKGETKSLSDLKNKVVLVDFWYVGCAGCVDIHPFLDSLYKVYRDRNFVLITICLDYLGNGKSSWLKAVEEGRYTSSDNINLYAPGKNGDTPSIVKYYHIDGCPTVILINKKGRLSKTFSEPRMDNGKKLKEIIESLL